MKRKVTASLKLVSARLKLSSAGLSLVGIAAVVLLLFLFFNRLPAASTEPTTYTATVYPTDDSHTYWYKFNHKYANTNYGKYSVTYIEDYSTYSLKYSFIKFDISSLPEDAVITKAEFRFRPYSMYNMRYVETIDVHNVDDNSWSESTITWNNQPGVSGLVAQIDPDADYPILSPSLTYPLDITERVKQDFNTDKMVNLRMSLNKKGTYYSAYIKVYTKEYSFIQYRPYLYIEYQLPEPEIPEPPSTQLPLTDVLNRIWSTITGG